MFYQITDKLTEISSEEYNSSYLTAGYVSRDELGLLSDKFAFSASSDCEYAFPLGRRGV